MKNGEILEDLDRISKDFNIPAHPLLTREKEKELIERAQRGDMEAEDRIIRCNIRLVVKIALGYTERGLSLEDLVQEGTIGFLMGIRRFKEDKGVKLSTYAALWVHQRIRRVLANQTGQLRLPVHVGEAIARINRTSIALEQSLERKPTDEEVADEMGEPVDFVTGHLSFVRRSYVSVGAPISGDDSETTFGEVIADPNAEDPGVLANEPFLAEQVERALGMLTPKERAVLEYRFGFRNGGESLTLGEVGKGFGVTRERIRQIQDLALRKLRGRLELLGENAETLSSRMLSRRDPVKTEARTRKPRNLPRVRKRFVSVQVPLEPSNESLHLLHGKVFAEKEKLLSAGVIRDVAVLEPLGNAVVELLEYVYGVEKEFIRNPSEGKGGKAHKDVRRIAMYLLHCIGFTRVSVSVFFNAKPNEVRSGLLAVWLWMKDPRFAGTIERLTPAMRNSRNVRNGVNGTPVQGLH